MRRFTLPVLSSFLVSSHSIAFLLFSSSNSQSHVLLFISFLWIVNFPSVPQHFFLFLLVCPLFLPSSLLWWWLPVLSLLLFFLLISCLSSLSSSLLLLLQGHNSYKCGPSIPQRDTMQHNAIQLKYIKISWFKQMWFREGENKATSNKFK